MKLKEDLVKEVKNLEEEVRYLQVLIDQKDEKLEEFESRDKVRLAEVKFYKRVYQDLFLNRNVVLADKEVNFN